MVAHCVISAIADADVDYALVPVCMVHAAQHRACTPRGRQSGSRSTPSAARSAARRSACGDPHPPGQRPLIIHDEHRIPDLAGHVVEDDSAVPVRRRGPGGRGGQTCLTSTPDPAAARLDSQPRPARPRSCRTADRHATWIRRGDFRRACVKRNAREAWIEWRKAREFAGSGSTASTSEIGRSRPGRGHRREPVQVRPMGPADSRMIAHAVAPALGEDR